MIGLPYAKVSNAENEGLGSVLTEAEPVLSLFPKICLALATPERMQRRPHQRQACLTDVCQVAYLKYETHADVVGSVQTGSLH